MSLGRNGMRTDLVLRHNHDTATFPTLTKILNTNPGPDPNTNHNSSFFLWENSVFICYAFMEDFLSLQINTLINIGVA